MTFNTISAISILRPLRSASRRARSSSERSTFGAKSRSARVIASSVRGRRPPPDYRVACRELCNGLATLPHLTSHAATNACVIDWRREPPREVDLDVLRDIFSRRNFPFSSELSDLQAKELSAKGDDLERMKAIVDFEMYRANLEPTVPGSGRARAANRPMIMC